MNLFEDIKYNPNSFYIKKNLPSKEELNKLKEYNYITYHFNLCNTLDLDEKIFAYRYLKRDIDTGNIKWKWITLKDNERTQSYFIRNGNGKEGFYTLSIFHPKVMYNYYANTINKRNIKHKLLKNINNEDLAVAAYKLDNKQIIGVSQKEYSNVLRLDIDCHDKNYNHSFNNICNLINFIGKNQIPIFLEESEKGGYHIYYKLEKYITREKMLEFVNLYNSTFKEENFKIECPYILRLPMSCQYNVLQIKNKQDLNKFLKNNILEEINTLEELYKNINENYINNSSLINLEHFIKEKICDSQIENKIKPIIPFVRESKNSNKKSLKQKYDEISIGLGTRNTNMFKMAFYGNLLNYDEYTLAKDAVQKNSDSKDFKRWNYNTDKIAGIFKTMLEYHKKNTTTEYKLESNSFISNKKFIEDEIIDKINTKIWLNDLIDKFGNIKEKKRKQIEQIGLIVVTEILGKIKYNEENPKKIKSSIFFSKNKKNQLSQGIQFSRCTLRKMKEYYNWKNIDINKLYKAIMNTFLFRQIKLNKRGYFSLFLKSCKQYLINSNKYNNIKDNINYIINKYILIYKKLFNKSKEIKTKYIYMLKIFSYKFISSLIFSNKKVEFR